MPNTNPTIVSASLSDKELQDSINKMVANFDKGLQTMLEHSNEYVGKIQASLEKIGNTNFGAKGSNDGAVVKQTKAQNEFTDAVKKSTNEIKRQGKETAMSFDQIAAAQQKAVQSQGDSTLKKSFNRQELQQYIDRLRELQAEYIKVNTQQGGGVKSDKIKADIRNLEELIAKYREILRNLDYVNSRQGTIDVKKWVQDLGAVDDRYKKLVRWYTVLEKEDQRRIASEEKANQKRLADLEKEKAAQDKVVKSYQDSVLKAEFGKVMKMPTSNIDEIRAKFERLSTIIANIRELGILSPEKISAADSEVKKLGASIQRYEKFEQERIAAEQKFVIEQAKETEQTQTLEGRVKGLAQAAREYMKANSDSRWSSSAYGKDLTIYAEGDVRARGLSIEEQITRQLQTEKEMISAQVDGAKKLNDERKKTTTEGYEIYDATRAKIASKLGIKQDEVISADASTDSIKRVSSALKQLQDAYAKMDASERKSPVGQHMIRQMQELERQTQQLRAQMSRPISLKDALGGSEKTLDDIAYKMQRLRSYKQGIDLTKPNATNEIKQVDEALAKLQKDADKWMGKSNEMIKSNTALGRSWNYMKNRLAFYFTVGASTSFIKNLIEVRSQYEMNERALGILINSAERGTQIFNELSQMALVSPYTLIELSTAAKQLTAYDIAAKDVVDTTRRLADMASAVGIPIERLTYALGQIKAYGYLNSRDARMFANAGIPLVKQLSDYYTQLEGRLVSTADVYDRIKKKTIDYEQVVQVINKMTDEGGKFFDFQAKMADTLKVRLANLTLAWNNMLNDMGSSNQGVLTTGIGLLRDMFLHWKDLESAISKVATAFGIYKTAQLVTLIWTARITTAMGVQELVGKKLQERFASLTIAQKGFVSAATAGWAALAFVVADAWLTISRNMEEIEKLNNSIAEGAKESYEAIDKMLHSSEMVSTRLSAAQGKLSDTDAAKAWEMLREQIELSAASSKELIAQLLKEPDINKRVTESFNLAEKIEEANRKLSNLNDSLDVSQNSILGGLFGEGLAEDIDDYNARLKYTSDVAEWAAKKNKGFWENAAMGLRALFNEVKDTFGSDANEAQDEIKNFAQKAAQTIKDELGEEGIKDKIQVNEAIARVVRGMEQQFPQIRGKGKVLFETIFYETMANEFKGAVDSQAYYYEKFLEQLKKDHASAFSGVTEDINKETFKWSSAQIDAIQKTADKVKKDLPAASQGAIDEILRQLNSTDFKVRIVAEMATTSLDNVQKQFREKFIEKPWIANDKEREKAENEANQKYGTLMRKNTESNAEYEKRISDERKKQLESSQKNADIISKNQGKQDEFSKSVLADAQKQKEAADDWLKAAKDIEDKGGYDFSTKSERTAAKKAESELAKALKEELSTIDKVRSIYKDLTKEGMSHANAVERATRGWDETVNAINRVLQKNGLQKLDLSKFAGIENPRELVNMLQSQLNTLLKRGAKPAEIKELQTKVNTLEVDADKYDLTKITKGLNNELGKLKDEYELAVELDANPELGDMFADYFGINLKELPKDYEQALRIAQNRINTMLKENPDVGIASVDIDKLMSRSEFDSWVKSLGKDASSELIKSLTNVRSWLYKVRSDETKKQIQEWDKMLEKYAEYEHKKKQITEEYEKETAAALKMGANASILKAIENRRNTRYAELDFSEFMKTPEWVTATGNLAGMSKTALDMLIDRINKYKNTAKYLSPKQIKELNKALKQLHAEQKKNNPFKAISNMLAEAKERMQNFDKEIEDVNKEIGETETAIKAAATAGQDTSKQTEALEKLKERLSDLNKAKKEVGKFDASEWVGAINETVTAVQAAVGVFNDLAKAIGGINSNDIDKVFGVLEKAGSSAAIGASIGGGYGAVVGAVVGAATSIISWIAGASNERITAKIEDSERAVKRLENAMLDLEDAANHAYGAMTSGAKRAIIANKELQLAELKRQIQLEKSRDSKDKDESKIIELEGQYKQALLEIKNGIEDIVNEMLGISSAGDAITQLVEAMIDAFRNGEDAMDAFSKKWDEMIDSMILKLIVSEYMKKAWDKVMENLKKKEEEFLSKSANDKAWAQNELYKYENMGEVERGYEYAKATGRTKDFLLFSNRLISEANSYMESLRRQIAAADEAGEKASDDFLKWSLDYMMGEGRDYMTQVGKNLADALGEWYTFGQDKDKNLSALQQGLQGVSEETASAVEAYLNGMSQQAYLRNDLLTQIRDTIMSFDMDVQLGVFSQMLLQLQNNYIVMQSMQSMMENWTVPSGSGIRVELMS